MKEKKFKEKIRNNEGEEISKFPISASYINLILHILYIILLMSLKLSKLPGFP